MPYSTQAPVHKLPESTISHQPKPQPKHDYHLAGIAYATEQIIDLVANGISNIHLYTMNKPWIARKIVENLSSIIHMG